jgi:hypothetical protein
MDVPRSGSGEGPATELQRCPRCWVNDLLAVELTDGVGRALSRTTRDGDAGWRAEA